MNGVKIPQCQNNQPIEVSESTGAVTSRISNQGVHQKLKFLLKGKDAKQASVNEQKGSGLNINHSRSNNKLSDATFGIDQNMKENVQTHNIAAKILTQQQNPSLQPSISSKHLKMLSQLQAA